MLYKKCSCLILLLFLFFTGQPLVLGDTTTATNVGQTIGSGDLSITGPESISSLGSIEVKTTSQSVMGGIGPINVSDQRGTGAGWSSSLAMQNLTFTKSPSAFAGNMSPLINLNASSRYDGSCGVNTSPITYTISISRGGSVGTATYSVNGGCSDSNQANVITSLSGNAVGSNGVTVDFPDGQYVTGNRWSILVDVYPFGGILLTPQTPTAAIEGADLNGLTKGTATNLSGGGTQSAPKLLLTAATNKGMGSYNQNVDIQLTVHALSLSGTYSGTIIFSVT